MVWFTEFFPFFVAFAELKPPVRQMFDGKEGMFDGGLHTPSEADVTAQMKALSVARMGVAAEAKAIGKYEAETAQLIEQAIQYSAVGRTLTKIGARKDVQAPAGVVTAGAQYTKSGGELSGSAAAKLREARESAAFLEALRRRNLSRHGKVSTKSVTDRLGFAARPADPLAVGTSPDPLEALFSDLTSNSTRKANKARKAAAKLPEAARIEYVQANFHDILMQMMEAGALEVNGATTLTEDNAPCL